MELWAWVSSMERKRRWAKEVRGPDTTSEKGRAVTYHVLLIAGIKNADACGREVAERAGVVVEVTTNRRAGLAALRRSNFEVVLVEENLAEGDPGWADQVWQLAGAAIAIQVNLAIVSCARLSREVKAALVRKESERVSARRAVASEFEADLKLSITGLLVQGELALQEPELPDALEPKLRRIVELAGALRERIDQRALQVGC